MNSFTPDLIKNVLFDSINSIVDNKQDYFINPETAFSRTQKISLRDTMLFPIVATKESTSVELLDFFPLSNLPTPAAINYRRNQIRVSAFHDLLTTFTSKIPASKKFHGMRIIACDGTRINTPYNPKDADSFVDVVNGKKGFNQYHLNTCYDVLNNLYVDAVIQGYFKTNERAAFCEMMDRYITDGNTIFTADRGYASFNVIAHAINHHHFFVIRLTKKMAENIFDNSKELSLSNEFDIEDCIHIGRRQTKETKDLANYHYINPSCSYDFIPGNGTEVDCFNVREIKFELSSGSVEYLLTNLPKSDFSTADIKEIYRLRWEIETAFRYLKYTSGLVHIHSIKQAFIFQEIYSKLIGYNFCAAIMNCINYTNTKGTKHRYVIDKTYLFKTCIRFLKGKIDEIISLIKNKKVPVRADRTFNRKIRCQHADTLQYR